ncbi:MAG TPA: DUF5640 domain-containing protein [Thermoanaerobaculia bacterium]
MRTSAIRLLCLAVFLTAPALPARAADTRPAAPLIGRWHSVENDPRSGASSVFEFRGEGVFDYSPADVVEMPYRVEGDALFLPNETKGGPDHKQTIEWVGEDRIRLSAPGTLSQFLDRKPGSGLKKSLVGEWTGPRDLSGRTVQAVYLFRNDGRVLLVMTLLTAQGRYTLDGDKIQMLVPNKWSASGKYKVDGDTLTLSIEGQKGIQDSKYARY